MARLFSAVGRRAGALALTIAVGAAAGYAYSRLAPPSYTARAYVLVVSADPGAAGAAVNFAQAYARIAGQDDVLSLAVESAKGTTTMDELARDVRTVGSPDAPMIEVTASATSGPRAALLANAVASGLIATAAKQSAATRMSLSMLSVAVPPTAVASPPPPRTGAALGAGAGLLLGILVLLAGAARTLTGRPGRRSGTASGDAAPPAPALAPAAAGAVGPLTARLGSARS